MRFIGKLITQEIEIQTSSAEVDTEHERKFLISFFNIFFSKLFEEDYNRNRFPIINTNHIHIYEVNNLADIYIIFIEKTDDANPQIVIEYESYPRYSPPTLIAKMLECECKIGCVLWGKSLNYYNLGRTEEIEKVIHEYINKYK